MMSTQDIYNYLKISDEFITGGQPTLEQLQAAANEGVQTIINLAKSNSQFPIEKEAGLAQTLGLTYHHIPVDWENPLASDFAAFEQVMLALPPGKTLLHCAANFRATAFYALYAQKHLGWSTEQAERFRAQIWAGSDYPIWEAFIKRMREETNR